jgi:hypothetical protein
MTERSSVCFPVGSSNPVHDLEKPKIRRNRKGGADSPLEANEVSDTLMNVRVVGPRSSGGLPNWALAGLLTVFVGASYLTIFRRVSKNDLENELERELEEEARRQAREESTKSA